MQRLLRIPVDLPVGEVRNVVLAEERDKLLFTASHNGVVVALVDAGFDITLLLANVDELLHFLGSVVG